MQRGQEESDETGLAGFLPQLISIASALFWLIPFLHSCPCFIKPKQKNGQLPLEVLEPTFLKTMCYIRLCVT